MAIRLLAFLAYFFLGFNVSASAAERFIDNQNGTVTDTQTGLVWQKTDSYHDVKKSLSWYGALDYADQKNGQQFAGHNDWRLPTLEEIKTLWDPARPSLTKDEQQIGLPKTFASGGSYYLWAINERGLDMAWYYGLGQKEEYFNLKEASDLGQGAKLVRNGNAK